MLETLRAQLQRAKDLLRLGQRSEAIDVLTSVEKSANKHGFTSLEIDVLLTFGKAHRQSGDLERAHNHFERALEIATAIGDTVGRADSLNRLASVSHMRGDLRHSYSLLEQALELYRSVENRKSESDCLNNIGILLFSVGDYPASLAKHLDAYAILSTLEKPKVTSEVGCLNNIGNTYRAVDDLVNAARYYKEGVELARKHDLFDLLLGSSINYSVVKGSLGDTEESRSFLLASQQISIERSRPSYEMAILQALGDLEIDNGSYHLAQEYFEQALKVGQRIENQLGQITSLIGLANATISSGEQSRSHQLDDIQRRLSDALGMAESLEAKKEQSEIHHLLAKISASNQLFDIAYQHHCRYHELDKEIFNEVNKAQRDSLTASFDLQQAQQQAETYRERADLIEGARQAAQQLVKQRTKELEQAKLEVVTRLALAAEYRDDITGQHTKRVGYYAAAIALEFGMSEHQAYLLQFAARLHDVGKIGVPDAVLLKPGRLNPEEFEIIKEHTHIGERILSDGKSALLRMARDIAISHHERWDGSGYPYGLSGRDIPRVGRIVAVADVFDALTQPRPYKDAWPLAKALAELNSLSGSDFDPEVALAAETVFSRLSEISDQISLKDLGITVSLEEQVIRSKVSEVIDDSLKPDTEIKV